MAVGQTIGAIGGAAVGGPAGMAVGSALGGFYDSWKEGQKAKASMPELVDPMQSSYLAELNQKRKSIETGADFSTAVNEADSTQAATNEALLRTSGGNPGAAMQGLLLAQRTAGDAKNRAIAKGQQQATFYNNAYGNLLNQISGRKLQLELYQTDQALARQAAAEQGANQNFMAGLGRAISGDSPLLSMGSGTGAAPSQPSAPAGMPSLATPPYQAPASSGFEGLGELANLGLGF